MTHGRRFGALRSKARSPVRLCHIALASAFFAAPAAADAPPAPSSSAQASSTAPLAPPPPAKKASQAERDAARALAVQGFEKLQQNKFSDAIALFLKAEEHVHAPTHWLYIAQAREKRGELLEAAEIYRKVAAETLAKDAPPPFREAQAQAGPALESVLRRTPKLRVEVTGTDAPVARVTVADRSVDPGKSESWNPGTYAVRVAAPGLLPVDRTVVLSERSGEVVVRVDLVRPISIAWPVLILGAGAALGGIAIGIGVYSHDLGKAADDYCRDLLICPTQQLKDMERSHSLRDTAIVTGVASAAVLVAGLTLLILRPSHRSSVEPPSAAATVSVRAGPGFVGLTGSF